MGKKDVTTRDTCPYTSDKRDCDGNWDTYCMKNEHCQYQKNFTRRTRRKKTKNRRCI